MKIGFIGLGTMGASMAANLQKSQHRLVVNDARKDAAEAHIGAGAEWADTPRAVAEQCDVVFTSLPGPPEVEALGLADVPGVGEALPVADEVGVAVIAGASWLSEPAPSGVPASLAPQAASSRAIATQCVQMDPRRTNAATIISAIAPSPTMARLAASGQLGGGEGIDCGFEPDVRLGEGKVVAGAGWRLDPRAPVEPAAERPGQRSR